MAKKKLPAEDLQPQPLAESPEAPVAEALQNMPVESEAPMTEDLQAGFDQLLASYQELQEKYNALEAQYNALLDAPQVKPAAQLPDVPADTFEVDGQAYRMALPKIKIKNIGERTALEVLLDDEPYEKLGGLSIKAWLVSSGSKAVVPA